MGKWGWVQPEYRKFEPFKTPFTALFLKMSHKPMEVLLHAGSSRKVEQRWVSIPSEGGEMQVLISEPKETDEKLPLMIYTHGGGFGFGAAPQHRWMNALFAREANCRVLMPDYRLLPEHPYPAAREDCFAAYAWACEHAEELHIDPERIAVGGESAGGALAIYLCHDAEKQNLPAPKFQMLIYPVADERMETESMKKYTDTPMWNAEHNAEMWRMYLEGKTCPEASPMEMELPQQLPLTYMEIAELDCLHDEGAAYARRLEEAGGTVELHEIKGVFHGYDVDPRTSVMQECLRNRADALRRGVWGE